MLNRLHMHGVRWICMACVGYAGFRLLDVGVDAHPEAAVCRLRPCGVSFSTNCSGLLLRVIQYSPHLLPRRSFLKRAVNLLTCVNTMSKNPHKLSFSPLKGDLQQIQTGSPTTRTVPSTQYSLVKKKNTENLYSVLDTVHYAICRDRQPFSQTLTCGFAVFFFLCAVQDECSIGTHAREGRK